VKKRLAGLLGSNAVGSLGRDVRVELVDLSRSGCLLNSRLMIPTGTVGILTLEIDGELYADDVRVTRCLKVPGAGECHDIGVEFLELRPPRHESLRRYAASLCDGRDGIAAPTTVRFRLIS
jgi:PilZ domain